MMSLLSDQPAMLPLASRQISSNPKCGIQRWKLTSSVLF